MEASYAPAVDQVLRGRGELAPCAARYVLVRVARPAAVPGSPPVAGEHDAVVRWSQARGTHADHARDTVDMPGVGGLFERLQDVSKSTIETAAATDLEHVRVIGR